MREAEHPGAESSARAAHCACSPRGREQDGSSASRRAGVHRAHRSEGTAGLRSKTTGMPPRPQHPARLTQQGGMLVLRRCGGARRPKKTMVEEAGRRQTGPAPPLEVHELRLASKTGVTHLQAPARDVQARETAARQVLAEVGHRRAHTGAKVQDPQAPRQGDRRAGQRRRRPCTQREIREIPRKGGCSLRAAHGTPQRSDRIRLRP